MTDVFQPEFILNLLPRDNVPVTFRESPKLAAAR